MNSATKNPGHAAPGAEEAAGGSSLDLMAEEIFSLTVLSWRQRVASKSAAGAELSESQYLAIETLVHSTGVLTVGEIQRGIGVLPAQMSRIMRSMESGFEKPLIRCELNQADKRKIDVKLTVEGRKAYEEFRHARLSRTVETLKQLAEKDRTEFVRICRRIRELMTGPKGGEKSANA